MTAAATTLLLWRFAAACAGSVVLAVMLAALLPAAARRWPALVAHRSTWLLAQGAVALAVLLALPAPLSLSLPRTVALPVVAVTIDVTAPILPQHEDSGAAEPRRAAAGAAPAPRRLVAWLPAAWLLVYLAGLAWHGARRLHAARRWHARLRRHSETVAPDALHDWPAITPAQRARIAHARLRVRTTRLPMSPLLLGGRRRCLVLPAHLRALSMDQQHLVVEHELTHWRRADPHWLALAAALSLLFWFNRPFARLVDGLRDAVELGCDDAVLAGRGPRERQGYAAALVAQLRLAHMGTTAAPAFGQTGIEGRVLRMRTAQPPRLSARGRAACVTAACGLAAFGAMLQPAFSSAAAVALPLPLPLPLPAGAADSAPPIPWRAPLAALRVTMLYGVRHALLPHGNHGVDLAARRGTPVLAVAGGTVAEAAENPTWGRYVRIDHGGGRASVSMHLQRIGVAVGQRVAVGTAIGTVGDSGRATGPHLHLEYWRDGRRLDPALMLAGLSSHATAQALARRRAQGNPVPDDE